MSSEIKLNGVATFKDITPSIPISDINSNTSFSMNNIHVVESYGFNIARVSIGRVGYDILNQDFSKPSLLASPTDFRLGPETPGIVEPAKMVCKAIDGLIDRLDLIDYCRSVVEFGVYKFTIQNETHSIVRLLSWYVYQLDPTSSTSPVACYTPRREQDDPTKTKRTTNPIDIIAKDDLSKYNYDSDDSDDENTFVGGMKPMVKPRKLPIINEESESSSESEQEESEEDFGEADEEDDEGDE
ncbi:hypothetical protein PC121_g16594 [Phytophthora cactorum]|nr:hypothetical protein PC121_g16594 [Phytophthora cactorum]